MTRMHLNGCDPLSLGLGARSTQVDPMTRVIEAALDLAWMEAADRDLDDDELHILSICDEMWHVRADIARSMTDGFRKGV